MVQETEPKVLTDAEKDAARVEAARQSYIAELSRHPGGKRLRPNSSWDKVNATTYAVCQYWSQKLGRPVDYSDLAEIRQQHLLGSN